MIVNIKAAAAALGGLDWTAIPAGPCSMMTKRRRYTNRELNIMLHLRDITGIGSLATQTYCRPHSPVIEPSDLHGPSKIRQIQTVLVHHVYHNVLVKRRVAHD